MTLLEILAEDWIDQALCAQVDPELFFPEKGGSTRAAKRTCQSCDVREQCLAYALEHNERFGIWGGVSERERRKLSGQKVDPELCGTYPRGGKAHERAGEDLCDDCQLARSAYYRLRYEKSPDAGPVDLRETAVTAPVATTTTEEMSMPTITAPARDSIEVTDYVADMARVLSRTEGHPDKLVRDIRKLAVQSLQALATATDTTSTVKPETTSPASPSAAPDDAAAKPRTPSEAAQLMNRYGITAKHVRSWAKDHVPGVPERGALALQIVQAYVDAHESDAA